jgi:hypothetical protein
MFGNFMLIARKVAIQALDCIRKLLQLAAAAITL